MPIPSDDVAARAQRARDASPFLTTQQTAFYLGLAARSLRRMRAEARGPACRMHGRAYYYHIDDIEAWSNASKRGGDHG